MALASITATYMDSEPEDDENVDTENVNIGDDSEAKFRSSADSASSGEKSIKLSGLVSYNDDTLAGDTTSGDLLDEDQWEGPELSPESKLSDDIQLYPEPPGRCSNELQERVNNYFKKMETAGLDINDVIQRNKEFRNPSIYEKLVSFVGIEELGSNFPRHIYDPCSWGKESYYEALASVQKEEMDKLMKERKEKTKVQVVTGTVKRPGSGIGQDEDGKRKSKWDQKGTSSVVQGHIRNPTGFLQKPALTLVSGAKTSITPLTTVVSGTKSSVIPAFGALTKRPKV